MNGDSHVFIHKPRSLTESLNVSIIFQFFSQNSLVLGVHGVDHLTLAWISCVFFQVEINAFVKLSLFWIFLSDYRFVIFCLLEAIGLWGENILLPLGNWGACSRVYRLIASGRSGANRAIRVWLAWFPRFGSRLHRFFLWATKAPLVTLNRLLLLEQVFTRAVLQLIGSI